MPWKLNWKNKDWSLKKFCSKFSVRPSNSCVTHFYRMLKKCSLPVRPNKYYRKSEWVKQFYSKFYDLLNILKVGNNPSENRYVFLGDYINKGSFSVQIIILLYSYKITYPNNIILLRGHQQVLLQKQFKKEVLQKYNIIIYQQIIKSFKYMPIAAIVNQNIFLIHSGLSPQITKVDQINKFNRLQITVNSPIYQMMTSVPTSQQNGYCQDIFRLKNDDHYQFGLEASQLFLQKSKLITIIRSHEGCVNGFYLSSWEGFDKFPKVITVYSNYHNSNFVGTFIRVEIMINQYEEGQEPYFLPNNMNVFEYTIPFLSEKITEIMMKILQFSTDKFEDNEYFGSLKVKINSIAKFIKLQKMKRKEKESILNQYDDLINYEGSNKNFITKKDEKKVNNIMHLKSIERLYKI